MFKILNTEAIVQVTGNLMTKFLELENPEPIKKIPISSIPSNLYSSSLMVHFSFDEARTTAYISDRGNGMVICVDTSADCSFQFG